MNNVSSRILLLLTHHPSLPVSYQRLLQTIGVLEAQRTQAILDLEALARHQRKALANPISFVEQLQKQVTDAQNCVLQSDPLFSGSNMRINESRNLTSLVQYSPTYDLTASLCFFHFRIHFKIGLFLDQLQLTTFTSCIRIALRCYCAPLTRCFSSILRLGLLWLHWLPFFMKALCFLSYLLSVQHCSTLL